MKFEIKYWDEFNKEGKAIITANTCSDAIALFEVQHPRWDVLGITATK